MDEEKKKFTLKGKGNRLMQIGVAVLVIALLVQNTFMIKKMNKLLGNSEISVHEIYDDTKVVKAYKNGKAEGLNEEDTFVLEKIQSVISDVITEEMSDYEKEKAIYDWQVAWVNYDDSSLSPITAGSDKSHTPYGVLKFHQAICVGNATTFKLFMDCLDIPCDIIHSTEQGEHAWDVVQLDDDWYHVDVTFDGGSNGNPGYAYFNVPDSIKDDGSWPWDHDTIPAANGSKYCYLSMAATELDDLYGIPNAISQAISDGKVMATFTMKDVTGFTREVADYIGNAMYVQDGSVYFDAAYSIGGKTLYKYTINSWDDSEPERDPELYAKLDELISEANNGVTSSNENDGSNMEEDNTEECGK